MVAICREAGVISLVDGAHSIGQELDINLSEARPDFWVSVCPSILPFDYRDAAFVSQRIATNGSFRRGEAPSFTFQRGLIIFSSFVGSDRSARGKSETSISLSRRSLRQSPITLRTTMITKALRILSSSSIVRINTASSTPSPFNLF